jgi:pyruvate/2-oxoglutarate dehydrogenase complex dihydrolipoamide dehydrogenase (E3) component
LIRAKLIVILRSDFRMVEVLRPDLCVFGAGAGGVAAAYAAAAAGASVAVVENRQFNEGYPNPALLMHVLIDAARSFSARRNDPLFGPPPHELTLDRAALRARAEKLAARLTFDSPTKLAALNINVIQGKARFTGRRRLETADAIVEAKWFILAPGAIPPLMSGIKGFEFARALRLEALLDLDAWPDRLVLIGGSPHGLALAQALCRLGAQVHLFEAGRFLPEEDRELVVPLLNRLRRDGVVLHEEAVVDAIEPDAKGFHVVARERGKALRLAASHLMVTAAPVPLTEGLGLAEAQVKYDKTGVKVDANLRTSNPHIYAIGDVLGGLQSYANTRFQAHRVIGRIFEDEKRTAAPVPRLVFTDPQLAVIGLTEAQAHKADRKIRILRASFNDNVAAQIAGESEGHVKIITDSYGRLLGAGIVAPQARELIALFGLAIGRRLLAKDLRGFVPASPSLTETGRLAALASPPQLGKALWLRIFPVSRRFY